MGTKKGVGIANNLLPLGGKEHVDFALFMLAAATREGMRDAKKRFFNSDQSENDVTK